MPFGIVIPVEENEPLLRKEFVSFTDYQESIDGHFQVIDLANPYSSLYVDEEGKPKKLEVNRRATLLMWMHNPAFNGRDVVCGTAVLIGQPDEEGETQTLPEEMFALLMSTDAYKVEVQTVDNQDVWNTNQAVYDDWVEAYNAGLLLADRWMAVEQVRVVPA